VDTTIDLTGRRSTYTACGLAFAVLQALDVPNKGPRTSAQEATCRALAAMKAHGICRIRVDPGLPAGIRSRQSWYDLLCNIADSGDIEVVFSPSISIDEWRRLPVWSARRFSCE
jgi:DNA repair photolyase